MVGSGLVLNDSSAMVKPNFFQSNLLLC